MASRTPTLLDHFYIQLQKHPSSVAIEDKTQSANQDVKITYAQLDALSDIWGKRLRQAGVDKGWIVPLLSRRSIAMVAATLAILKLRATYVPIDIDSWGKDRIETVLRTVNPQIIVSTSACSKDHYLYPVVTLERIDFGETATRNGLQHTHNDEGLDDRGDDLAYIIFTSGTTGKPKGVKISQRSISRYVKEGGDLPFNFNTEHGTRVLLMCSIAFDVCAGVVFNTLCNGGTLVLADPSTFEAAAKICHVWPLTPSILATLDPKAGFDTVEKIFLGGESPSPSLIEAWSSPHRRLYNSYGPTETTCTTLMGELLPGSPITIGFPIAYSTVMLLDDDGLDSTEGEICIAGPGLALGYFLDPHRTDRAFIDRNGVRIYKTGDYGRRTKNGLQFCGRRDSLVKNRGFLINLEADVEPALQSYDKVDGASAFMSEGRLVAYVTPTSAKDGLRDYLAKSVSSFLIPDTIYSLDEFPTTSNGKVDRLSLIRMHQLEQEQGTASLEKGLSAVDAVCRGLSHVLRLPESQILQVSSFRQLGGHSLAAVMLVSVLRNMGFAITVAQVLLLDSVENIAAAAVEVIDVPRALHPPDDSIERPSRDTAGTRPPESGTIIPMTDMQIRMLGATVANPGLSFIKTSFTFDHPEKQDLTATLHAAWTRLHQRHGILRTTFILTSLGGSQVISEDPSFAWEEQFVAESEWESVCRRKEILDVAEFGSFDAEDRASLSKVELIIAPNKRTRFIWTVHHGLVDGWSMATLMRDFASYLDDKPLPAPPQFAQAAQAIGRLEFKCSDRALAFWREYLDGYTPAQRLRVSPPSDVTDYTQGDLSQKLTVNVPELEAAAKNQFAVTPATLLYAAWALLISRYTGTDRAVLGAVLSGRALPLSGAENIVGPLINTLPLAIDTQENQSTYGFVQSVFRRVCDILEFQWSPVALIQEGCGCNPAELLETLFALQYDFPQATWGSSKVPEPRDIRYNEATQVPLTVLLDSTDGRFDARFVYRRSHFCDAIVRRMARQFDNVLAALVAAPSDTDLSKIMGQMLTEREYMVTGISDQRLWSRKAPENLVVAIESSIQEHPDIYAVESSTGHLTYREVGRLTEHIVWHLSHYIQPGSVVCMVSDGSVSWLLAMIAIVRAGAIYCPVDAKLPRDRKNYMVCNSKASLILYANSSQDPVCDGVQSLNMESLMAAIPSSSRSPGINSRNLPSCDDVACLIYTSGSTGLPKAVQLQHRGILNVVSQPEGRLYSRPGQRNAQMLSLGFDCCIKEVFSTICFGATLVLKDPENTIAHLARVDATMATPSLLATLEPTDYPNLKVITVAGEAMSQVLSDKWAAGRILINGYGPAECTLISTTATLRPGNRVSIGKPLPGLRCYLLDPNRRPVPMGVSGELYISGLQVTPGYLHNEQETVKRFLDDPFNPGQAMFRTGDIVRLLEDGGLEYIGREDNQIKLRGFRIDLGEVQSTISKLASEAKNVAIVVSNGNLIAFMTPETIDVKRLAKSLESQLPQYAVPHRIIALPTLPTSANNKVDLNALQRYLTSQINGGAAVKDLQTDTQRAVAAIWAEVLGLDLNEMPISPSDRFFDLGGHSLLQIKVAQAISKRWDIQPLPLKQVIRHQGLEDLSLAVDQLVSSPVETVTTMPFLGMVPVARDGQLPLSYLEKEMLLNHLISGGSPAANMSFVCKITGDINVECLADAFQKVTVNIEVFRTRYSVINGTLFRRQAPATVRVPRVVQTGNLSSFIHGRITKCFDLSTEPPVDVSIIIGTPMQATLVVVMSHVVADATTMAVYLNQVSRAYELLGSNSQATTPATVLDPLSYIDWAQWTATLPPNPQALAFWSSYLFESPKPLTFGNSSPTAATYIGLTRSWTISSSIYHSLSSLATKASVTMHQLVLAAIFFALQCVDRQDDMLLAAPFMHRTEPGTESLPGLFLDRLLLRIKRNPHQNSLFEFLSSVRKSSQQALAHIIPFRAICSHLSHKPSLINPLFKVMVTYHTAADQRPLLELHGAEVQPIPWPHTGGSKFPLTVEFTETISQNLQVDMEYDVGCIREDIALRLEFALSFALQLMILETEVEEIIQLVQMSFRSGGNGSAGRPGLTGPGQDDSDVNFTNHGKGVDAATGQNGLESILAAAVCECLGLEPQVVDAERSFWDFGAQSIDGLQLQHICEKRGVRIRLRDIFVTRSIRELAACVMLI